MDSNGLAVMPLYSSAFVSSHMSEELVSPSSGIALSSTGVVVFALVTSPDLHPPLKKSNRREVAPDI